MKNGKEQTITKQENANKSLSQDGIVSILEYGTVEMNIRKYMEARRLTRYAVSRKLHTRYEVVNKWYNGKVTRIDADVLARMCYLLECEPGDLIIYKKPQNAEQINQPSNETAAPSVNEKTIN